MSRPPSKIFGQTMHRKQGGGGGTTGSSYQRQFGGGSSYRNNNHHRQYGSDYDDDDDRAMIQQQQQQQQHQQYRQRKQEMTLQLEQDFRIPTFSFDEHHQGSSSSKSSSKRRGWLYNMIPTTVRLCFGRIVMECHDSLFLTFSLFSLNVDPLLFVCLCVRAYIPMQ